MGSLKHLVFTKGNDTSIEWIPSMDALETLYLGDGVKTLERALSPAIRPSSMLSWVRD